MMPKMKSVSFSDVFADETSEWGLLAGLLNPTNIHTLHKCNDVLFTEDRIAVFNAMQETFTTYGMINLQGLSLHLKGNVPGELLATRNVNIQTAYDDCVRLATKRIAKLKAEQFADIAKQYSPDDKDIMNALGFTSIGAGEDSSLTTGAIEFLGNLHAKLSGDYRFASTGMPWLNTRMGGEWKPKSFVIIAAPPGGGKTTLVANSMLNMARQKDATGNDDPTASLFISLEMAKEDLYVKWAADILSIDSKHIAAAKITHDQARQVEDVVSNLQTMPMYVIDNGKITLYKIVKEIREHVSQRNVRVVFLDYIQIVNHCPTGNTNSDLGEVAETLKALAKELNITIVALSQLNRNGQGLDGIRDSGEIAQVADVVFLMVPESDNGDVRNVEVDFLKNRFGPIGKTAILFYGPYQRFQGMTTE
jgi:KaiC/GvpD/RAD55 family RecA-like ATPase